MRIFIVPTLVTCFILLLIAGWVMNLIKLTQLDFEAPYKAEVIRTAGLIPPVGLVVGWLDIEDGPQQ